MWIFISFWKLTIFAIHKTFCALYNTTVLHILQSINMSSSSENSFDTNGLEKVQYKTTVTNEDGVTETKVLTFYYEEEIKDKVPTKNMLDDSWQLVSEENETEQEKEEIPQEPKATEPKFAFQSPIPTISKLSISSKMPPTKLLVAKTA